ncbi:17805_t:CDS:1 [Cetraspora pellucida]|uniref:17805_t:CDS:1 n=1 Tax=Cetraspora pellucida TaxID=1433469 RepID=A0A9N9CHP1_9GLOM|nr:17805_t:CDS:1 [Cetraspora pellucida]
MLYAYKEPLAKLWKVNNTKIPTLLRHEKNLMIVDKLLQPFLEKHSTSFGGTFINVPKNRIIINVVGKVNKTMKDIIKSTVRSYRHRPKLVYRKVNNSLAALRYTFDQVSNLAERFKPLDITCYINIKLNYVVLQSFPSHDKQNGMFFDAVKQIRQYNETIHFSRSDGIQSSDIKVDSMKIDNINTSILGGDGLYNKQDHRTCSLGLWAKSNDLKSDYFVTAGHCSNSNNTSFYYYPWNTTGHSTYIGYMRFWRTHPLDVGLILINNDKIINFINTTMNSTIIIRNTDSKKNKLLISYNDVAVSSHGAHICKSGHTTHVTCGHVLGFNGFFTNLKKELKSPITFSTAISGHGDSGGTVFSYNQDFKHVHINGIHMTGNPQGYLPAEIIVRNFNLKLMWNYLLN